jgi:hypothetical protein
MMPVYDKTHDLLSIINFDDGGIHEILIISTRTTPNLKKKKNCWAMEHYRWVL